MATKDPARKFAEHALDIERILDSRHINGSAGRVVFILVAAAVPGGITQRQLALETNLPKDALSKLIGSLVKAKLVDQDREGYNARIKKLTTTRTGRKLISDIKAALKPPTVSRVREQPSSYKQSYLDLTVAE
jgi:DNA-binding MarR family transcriptional regulator